MSAVTVVAAEARRPDVTPQRMPEVEADLCWIACMHAVATVRIEDMHAAGAADADLIFEVDVVPRGRRRRRVSTAVAGRGRKRWQRVANGT